MEWGTVATWASALVGFLTLNAVTIQFILKWHDDQHFRDAARNEVIEKMIYELKAILPLEYVRREDWIRFGATLDAKLDAMRDEWRAEMTALKEKLYGRRD